MTFWPFFHFLSFTVYLGMAIASAISNPRAKLNISFSAFLLSLSVWSFGKVFVHSPYVSFEQVQFFENIAALGWTSFSTLFFIFSLVFNSRIGQLRLAYFVALIFSMVFFIYLQTNGFLLSNHIRQSYGWANVWHKGIETWVFFIFYFLLMILSVFFFFESAWASKSDRKKQQARIILATIVFPLAVGTVTDVIFPYFDIRIVPEMGDISAIFCPLGVIYAMIKYKFLTITPAMAADNIISSINEFLVLLNEKREIVTANKAISSSLGFKLISGQRQHLSVLFADESQGLHAATRLASGENILSQEYLFKTVSGEKFPVTFSASAVNDESGAVAGFVCIARDIRELKKTEDALRRAKEELEQTVEERTLELRHANERLTQAYAATKDILQRAPFGIYLIDQSGNIEYINEAMSILSGKSLSDLKKENVFHVDDYNQAGLDVRLSELLSHNKPFYIGAAKIDSYYVKKPAVVNFSGVSLEQASNKKAVVFVEDITDKLRLEADLVRAQKIESIGVLAGGIAHDYNNILSIVLSNISLARFCAGDNPELIAALGDAENSTKRAQKLTRQLLTFSRGGEPLKKIVDIKRSLVDTVNFSLQGSNCCAHFDIDEKLFSVDADADQINQVIQNLVINASQAMAQGGTVHVTAANVVVRYGDDIPLPEGDYIKVFVSDTGIGIPPENIGRVFDPYFTTKQKGSGLGLAITYSIIKKHNGHITVDSILGKGTTFRFYLPASKENIKSISLGESSIVRGSGNILVMDDEEMVCVALRRLLGNLGYTVSTVLCGEDAISLYRKQLEEKNPFDVVILDLVVPGKMGGVQTVQELLKIDPGVKAVVSSGYSSDPVMSEYKKYGFYDVMAKPYDIKIVSDVMRRVISPKT